MITKSSSKPLNLLQSVQKMKAPVIGGPFALPVEFESDKYAAQFAPVGNATKALKGPQIVEGTQYTAEGWLTWKHPVTGKPHKVTERRKDGETFILLYRPQEIQKQVNQAYANLSRERMHMEVTGRTVAGNQVTDDPGMLGLERLPRNERDGAPFEPPEAMEDDDQLQSQHITKKTKVLTR